MLDTLPVQLGFPAPTHTIKHDLMVTVDWEDSDLLNFYISPLTMKHTTYARVWFPKLKKQLLLHRVIMERMLGRPLQTSEWVDHKDHNGLNLKRSNLRLASALLNGANRQLNKNSTSGIKGVKWYRGKWQAHITINRVPYYLGRFDTAEQAAAAYQKAAKAQWGEFAHY